MTQDVHPNILVGFLITALAVCVYGGFAVLPAFNADDIIQIQTASGDANTFLATGRWGYYLVFHTFLETNPAGLFGVALGSVLLAASGLLLARFIGFQTLRAQAVFGTVFAISTFWGASFAFDSTWVAYPLGCMMIALGLTALKSRRWILAICLIAVAPSFNQSLIQFAGVALLGRFFIDAEDPRAFVPFIIGLAVLATALVLYAILTQLSPLITGIPIWSRASIDPIEALRKYERIGYLIQTWSMPWSWDRADKYYTVVMRVIVLIALCLTFVLALKRPFVRTRIIGICCLILLMMAPFALAFLSPLDEFGPRAIVAFSAVFGLLLAYPIERFHQYRRLGASVLAVAAIFTLFNAKQIASSAVDANLSWEADKLATSRIIGDIEKIVSDSDIPLRGPIPLAVRFENPWGMNPRGLSDTARAAPWSREWIFRMVDPRFSPVSEARWNVIMESATDRPHYPKDGSIFIEDGVVVVILN